MKSKFAAVVLMTCVMAVGGRAEEGSATFATKPNVTKEGDGAQIEFSLSAPTDVEVAVLDATNHVVRHLAGIYRFLFLAIRRWFALLRLVCRVPYLQCFCFCHRIFPSELVSYFQKRRRHKRYNGLLFL